MEDPSLALRTTFSKWHWCCHFLMWKKKNPNRFIIDYRHGKQCGWVWLDDSHERHEINTPHTFEYSSTSSLIIPLVKWPRGDLCANIPILQVFDDSFYHFCAFQRESTLDISLQEHGDLQVPTNYVLLASVLVWEYIWNIPGVKIR